jgi:hypothetical protein
VRLFDSFGSNDNDRVTAVNAYHQNHGGGVLEPIELPARVITHSVPFQAWSGMKLVGSPVRACEYSRATVLKFTGSGSQFVFAYPQTSQGYPSDGSPRDIALSGIQFEGPGNTDWWQRFDPSKDSYTGRVLWMSEFHGCAWKLFRSVYWGWWDGVTISGVTHVQAVQDTPFHVAGAECTLFTGESSFMDNTGWAGVPKPFIRSRLEKSTIGAVMPTARGFSYQIAVDGGRNLHIVGVRCDSQDSDPVSGASIRINGGSNINITNCSLKGQCDNLAAAYEHAAIEVVGGRHIIIQGNTFVRAGTAAPSSTPLVYTGPNVGPQAVAVGLNGFDGFDGVLRQAKDGQIVCIDPRMRVITG